MLGEAGQLAVIASAFLLVGWYCGNRAWYRNRIVVPASAMIACTAVYWTIQDCLPDATGWSSGPQPRCVIGAA
jgi:hypothetical protein